MTLVEEVSKRNWIRPIRIFLSIVLLMVILVSGVIFYFSINQYEINETPLTLKSYLENSATKAAFTISGNELSLKIPKEVLTTEIARAALNFQLPEVFDIHALRVNEQGRLEVNATYRGLDWSFSAAILIGQQDSFVTVDLEDMNITNKNNEFAYTFQQKILEDLFQNSFPIYYDTADYLSGDLVTLSNVIYENGSYFAKLALNQSVIFEELKGLGESANKELIDMYKNSGLETDQQAAELIESAEALTESDLVTLAKDYLDDQALLESILAMGDMDYVEGLFRRQSPYLSAFNLSEIIETQGIVLSDNLRIYYTSLMEALEQIYFINEYMYINEGRPFSFYEGEYTIKRINQERGLGIPINIINKLDFVYDKEANLLKMSYAVDSDTYLVLSDSDQDLYRIEAYQAMYDTQAGTMINYVTDLETWQMVEEKAKAYFSVEDVFVRYMKSDGHYLFAVISPSSSYQNYWAFAFEIKDGGLYYLMDNVPSIMALNQAYPEFNLKLVTTEIDTVTLYNVNEDTKESILEDLENKGLISNKASVEIVYCSYGENYLALQLDTGVEYVYYISGIHLHTVYTKEKALEQWEDVPEIILLQDKPE